MTKGVVSRPDRQDSLTAQSTAVYHTSLSNTNLGKLVLPTTSSPTSVKALTTRKHTVSCIRSFDTTHKIQNLHSTVSAMSSNALSAHDTSSQSAPKSEDQKPMSMEYHRQVLESRLKDGQ